MGKYFVWVGGWLTAAVFLISAYYPVIIGWCLYYLFISCTASELPGSEEAGMALFNGFARDSYWPVFCQILAVALTGAFSFGGIHLVEKANTILVPLLLLILVFTFGWSMTREYAEVGIQFLFTPTWSSFAQPALWIAAAGQNAFDTGAGMSVLLVYATYMDRSVGIVRYSVLIPVINNIVSLYASFTIFSTVFSTLIQTDGTITRSAILNIMQDSGPGSTGLTFTWIPVLFSRVGILGRVLSVLFFLCLTFAGISSLLATLQACVLVLKEIGVSHRISVAVSLIALVACGIPSAIKLEILENQDNTWGYALIISGALLALLVITYNPMHFRRVIINEYGTDDWPAPLFWIPIITVIVPALCIFLITWWIYDYIKTHEVWYALSLDSVTCTLLEWLILLVLLLATNFFVIWYKGELYPQTRKLGSDPYDPSTYEEWDAVKLDDVRLGSYDEMGTTITVARKF
ncbi:hypothetical protein EG68_04367 [Paragonimus skrjabini miyazakii]|uniref:Uncharacterized protein n=1 Tax=Paragonimus skrjabini miyazakii TaxID=59628 RepID=A0A8S9YTZ4_9TREM|nr:hypothetical protein EG68_04367 [Paragonimus skrjabini miyazakii]